VVRLPDRATQADRQASPPTRPDTRPEKRSRHESATTRRPDNELSPVKGDAEFGHDPPRRSWLRHNPSPASADAGHGSHAPLRWKPLSPPVPPQLHVPRNRPRMGGGTMHINTTSNDNLARPCSGPAIPATLPPLPVQPRENSHETRTVPRPRSSCLPCSTCPALVPADAALYESIPSFPHDSIGGR